MMKKKNLFFLIILSSLWMGGCSSGTKYSQNENASVDLTLQQVQTRLEDSTHDFHCVQSELQIIENRIKELENAIAAIKNMAKNLQSLEIKQQEMIKDVKQLSSHANETTTSFSQYKNRLSEFEKELSSHNQKLGEVHQLKGSLESVVESIKQASSADATYRVKAGDSLDRIAKRYHVSLEALKKANGLDQDRIVVGQELKIPTMNQ